MTDKHIVVVSGGTATNSLVSLFQSLSQNVTYVLPISDNGGSTSEILRVLGGPAIGDIRSRITRLITHEGFKNLLSYRLSEDGEEAKQEWTQIVEGVHPIWDGIEIHCKEMVRAFLIHVHMELLKKSRTPATNFRFELASIGNMLLTGARLFIGSLDGAIELILRMTRVDHNVQILPGLNTNYTYHISAQLQNGDIITGQSQISHPNEAPAQVLGSTTSVNLYDPQSTSSSNLYSLNNTQHEDIPYQHPDLLISQLKFSKTVNSPLKSPISRIFYINPYGEEIHPKANSRTIKCLKGADLIVYSVGSLMTSIIPVLILQGIGHSISENITASKVLLLNGNLDRETSGMTALDFINTIHAAAIYSFHDSNSHLKLRHIDVITHLVYMEDCEISVNVERIEALSIKCVKVKTDQASVNGNIHLYDLLDLQENLHELLET